MGQITSFHIMIALASILLYWIFGGVVFSIITVLRVGRVRRVQFGCLFSIIAVGMGIVSSWAGILLAQPALQSCVVSEARLQSWIEKFACGIIPILSVLVIGFILVLISGYYVFSLSNNDTPYWVEQKDPEDDENDI